MKILEQTPTRLTLQYRPLGFWLMGSLLIIIGIGIFTFGSETPILTCYRERVKAGYCKRTILYRWVSSPVEQFKISELQKIEITISLSWIIRCSLHFYGDRSIHSIFCIKF